MDNKYLVHARCNSLIERFNVDHILYRNNLELLDILQNDQQKPQVILLLLTDLESQNEINDEIFTLARFHEITMIGYISSVDDIPISGYVCNFSGIITDEMDDPFIKQCCNFALNHKPYRDEVIMVISEHINQHSDLVESLRGSDFPIFFFHSTALALTLTKTIEPSIIITDIIPTIDQNLISDIQKQKETKSKPLILFTSEELNEETNDVLAKLKVNIFNKDSSAESLLFQIEHLIIDILFQREQTVVIVEDSKTVNRMLSYHLAKANFIVESFEDGTSAMNYLSHHPKVDLFFLDWELPDIEGIDVCRFVRAIKSYAFTPIMMLTSRNDISDVELALKAGANDYITKPFNFVELNARIFAQMRIKNLAKDLEQKNSVLEQLALTDTLTGLFNRRHFDNQLGIFWEQSVRHDESFTLVMVDIDHFKKINDTYGHAIGDQILRHLSQMMKTICRTGDLVVRLGGEEFVLVLPKTTMRQAFIVSERIRINVSDSKVRTMSGEVQFTISMGIADREICQASDGYHILKMADDALYKAKNNGRNRVVIYTSQ